MRKGKNELEQKLKEGVISQKEYDYLMQNRTSGLPSYYKSFQFILFLAAVPLLQTLVFSLLRRFFINYAINFYLQWNIGMQVVFWGAFFLIYKLVKRAPIKMAAWVWFIITSTSILIDIFYLLRIRIF